MAKLDLKKLGIKTAHDLYNMSQDPKYTATDLATACDKFFGGDQIKAQDTLCEAIFNWSETGRIERLNELFEAFKYLICTSQTMLEHSTLEDYIQLTIRCCTENEGMALKEKFGIKNQQSPITTNQTLLADPSQD